MHPVRQQPEDQISLHVYENTSLLCFVTNTSETGDQTLIFIQPIFCSLISRQLKRTCLGKNCLSQTYFFMFGTIYVNCFLSLDSKAILIILTFHGHS